MPEPDETGADGCQPLAFISHHSSQVEQARHIARILGRHGIKGWMAPDDIEPGQAFDQVIIEQIGKCDVILLLFSARSDQSKHVKREVMLAEQQGKLIYPIRLESIQPDGLAYWLQDYQWIDWLDGRDDAIERMVATIRRQLSAQSTGPQPAPPSAPDPPLPPEPAAPLAAAAEPAWAAPAASDQLIRGLDNKALMILVPLGLLILMVIAAAVMGGDDEIPIAPVDPADPGSLFSSGGGGGPGAKTGEIKLKPGLWSSRSELVGFSSNMPGITPDMARAEFASQPEQECITQAEADSPRQALLDDMSDMGVCTANDLYVEDGDVGGSMTCLEDGASYNVVLAGSYTPTRIDLDINTTALGMVDGQSLQFRVQTKMVSTRIGDCPQ